MYSKLIGERGRSTHIFKDEVVGDKPNKQGTDDGGVEVRTGILPEKRGNVRGGKACG